MFETSKAIIKPLRNVSVVPKFTLKSTCDRP